MNGKIRRDEILEIIRNQGYTTVQYLTDTLHYSTATINRDLNILQGQKLIKRSYGGAELNTEQRIPVLFRYHKSKVEKRMLGMTAASMVHDGDTIFIDASTTTQTMAQYLTKYHNLTVITNNMALATYLSEQEIQVICLGGAVLEMPCMLGGDDTAEHVSRYLVDKMFFSTGGITSNGILFGSLYDSVHKAMMKNAKKVYYLVDSEKVDINRKTVLCDLNKVDVVITNHAFPDKMKAQYANTKFVFVEKKQDLETEEPDSML
jgi:DeoR/GlpR family transcriptional regulator of sugar metabolism